MIECYNKWCKYHPEDEPYCGEKECRCTKKTLFIFSNLRKLELEGQLYIEDKKND